jgi:putative redox protein
MGIVMWAAEKEVPLDSVAVEVHANWDAHGYLGLSESVPPGYTQLRVLVEITSSESDERIREVVAIAQRLSPYVDVYRRGNDLRFDLRVARAKAT